MILTSTVKIKSRIAHLAPVRTDAEISKEELASAMEIINKIKLFAPVKLGDIIVKNFVREGVNLVVTKTILK